ncbi:MAG: hypothetical protein KGL04_02380 [Elusimicrobia bacterium]|nr:hypothetical protein [Elusimicrobiota bacterium]
MIRSRRLAFGGLASLFVAAFSLPAGAQTDGAFFSRLNAVQAQVISRPANVFPPGKLFSLEYAAESAAPLLGVLPASREDLVRVDNDDNPSTYMEFSLDLDAAGAVVDLSFTSSDHPEKKQNFPVDGPIRSCSVHGSARLGQDHNCGVELCHAIFSTSAIRVLAAGVDPQTGGPITIIYLKHYSLFGKSREAELNLRLLKTAGTWALYTDGAGPVKASQHVEGLFIHRADRGIDAIIPCLGGTCPAAWARPYKQNSNLPPVYDAPGDLSARSTAFAGAANGSSDLQ